MFQDEHEFDLYREGVEQNPPIRDVHLNVSEEHERCDKCEWSDDGVWN